VEEILKDLPSHQHGAWLFHVWDRLPTQWIVERTSARINSDRPPTRDFERYTRTVAALIRLAMIRIMLKCLARSTRCS
jgi:transposase